MPRKPLKIAISIWSFTPGTGGLQAHTENLCKNLMMRGHEVTVITRSATRIPKGGDYLFFNEREDHIRVNQIHVKALRLSHTWAPVLWVTLKLAARPRLAGVAAQLYEAAAARPARSAFAGFDLIHHVGHATALAGFAAAHAAAANRIPFLVQPTAHPLNFGDSDLDFRLYHRADRLLVHTQYEREYFSNKQIQCPIDVVYNGIEDRSDGVAELFRQKHGIKGAIILYIGRKALDKGYPLVVTAFERVYAQNPSVVLVCMGPSSLDAERKAHPGILDLDYATEEEKHDALAACNFLCVPSEGESFGLVYMEAGRYRKAVIGRNLPVLKELLGDDAAVLLGKPVPNANKAVLPPEELAAAMIKLVDQPAYCQKIGDACHEVSNSYLWPVVVKNFENVYYRALNIS